MADSDKIDLVREDCAWSNPIDPTLLNNPTATLSMIMRMAARNIQCCIPAVIESYDRISHYAVVKPLCNATTNTGDSIERPSIGVHVIRIASGCRRLKIDEQHKIIEKGYIIDIPLVPGDTGWLFAADCDTFIQKTQNADCVKGYETRDKGPSKPNTNIIHGYRHGVFIPDSFCSFPDIARFENDLVIGTYTYNEEEDKAIITPFPIEEGSGGGGNGYGGMFAWTPPASGQETGTIGPGGCMIGRTFKKCETGIGAEKEINKTYSLKVTLSTTAATTLEVVSDVPVEQPANGNVSYIPIYKIGSNGFIEEDYRGAFVVPVYE